MSGVMKNLWATGDSACGTVFLVLRSELGTEPL